MVDAEDRDETTEEQSPKQDRTKQIQMQIVGRIVGAIVAAILIYFAKRDLRRRPDQFVRGPVLLWKIATSVPPGAVAYLVLGRRRVTVVAPVEIVESAAA